MIDKDGNQVGIIPVQQALTMAEAEQLDLVEISPNAQPPVCKIVDYGKYRYQQTKKEKESKKAQHQVKIKEIKVKPNIDQHDLDTKIKHAREFIQKGNKVRITCMFRGREMAHTEFGKRVIQQIIEGLADLGTPEETPKLLGRNLSITVAPGVKKLKEKSRESESESESKSEAKKGHEETI